MHAENAVRALQAIARTEGVERKFTLDGRLVGDIGELIVARFFEIVRNEKPAGHAHDLFAMVSGRKRGVQVKLRRESKTGRLEFKYQPEILISILFKKDWSQWRILYHGAGKAITAPGVVVGADLRFMQGRNEVSVQIGRFDLESQGRIPKYSKLKLVPRRT